MASGLRFRKDGTFTVLQFADVQENPFLNPDTFAFMNAVLDKVKPDFVVYTGDQLKSYALSFLGPNRRSAEENVLRKVLEPVTERGIPFTAVFGNHDEASDFSKEEQYAFYKKLGMVGDEWEGVSGRCNFNIEVLSNDSTPLLRFILFDSGSKLPDGSTAYVTPEQIDRYRMIRDSSPLIPTLAFQHIPIPETYLLAKELTKKQKGSYRGAGSRKRKFYCLPKELIEAGGFMKENFAAPDHNSGEFAAFKEKGEVKGVFFGHDHSNSFVGELDGIKIGYTQGCGFDCYGPGGLRGVRVFEFSEDDPANFKTYTVTKKEISGKRYARPITAYVYSRSPTSVQTAIPFVLKRLAIMAGITAAGIAVLKYRKH